MSSPISELSVLLSSMQAQLHGGVYVYVCAPKDFSFQHLAPIAMMREAEGLSLILEEGIAQQTLLPILFRTAWITLQVHSDLQAVGLTAAFSAALGQANISCNVIAGAYHDHIFVPVEDGQKALQVLCALQAQHAGQSPVSESKE